MCEGDMVLSNPPKVCVWSNKLGYTVDSLIKVKLNEGDTNNMLEAVEIHQSTFGIAKGWWWRHA
jgi:hypothetical protein